MRSVEALRDWLFRQQGARWVIREWPDEPASIELFWLKGEVELRLEAKAPVLEMTATKLLRLLERAGFVDLERVGLEFPGGKVSLDGMPQAHPGGVTPTTVGPPVLGEATYSAIGRVIDGD